MTEQSLEHLKLSNLGQLSGKVALVTGGGTGIGLMIAKGFAANGAKVYISGRRENVLQEVSQRYPSSMVPLKMDVTDKDSILYAVKVIEENEGKLDILVNNAGGVGAIYPLRAGFSDDSGSVRDERWSDSFFFNLRNFEDWSEIFKVNTTAAFFVTMAFVDLLKRGAKDGQTSSVILVTSVGAILKCCNNKPAYAASKAAIESLTNHLGAEFAYNGLAIRVNSILPGFFRTDILPPETYVELNDLLRSGTPYVAGTGAVPMRRFGAEEEMAATAVYLGSPMSGYTNGSHIVVDGGWHLVTT